MFTNPQPRRSAVNRAIRFASSYVTSIGTTVAPKIRGTRRFAGPPEVARSFLELLAAERILDGGQLVRDFEGTETRFAYGELYGGKLRAARATPEASDVSHRVFSELRALDRWCGDKSYDENYSGRHNASSIARRVPHDVYQVAFAIHCISQWRSNS